MYGNRFILHGEEPGRAALSRITWPLLKRVMSYARPYLGLTVLLLAVILAGTALGLVTPLLFRELIDRAIPRGDMPRLNLIALALLGIPVVNGLMGVIESTVTSRIGSSVIFDLRVALYSHLQRMSLRFFTHNKAGELMSRMNNDVMGAQTAISSTIVDILTNLITVTATLLVMLALDWRLTLLGLVVLPLFAAAARRLGRRLREVARQQMEESARMNSLMQETLNISGMLLVKLFGRHETEVDRFKGRASALRGISVKQAYVASRFFAVMGMVGAVGTALVYLVGGHLVVRGAFTVGTIVAFSSYLGQLYGPLRALAGAPAAFAQSMVSFERVFEVIDLPLDIEEKAGAMGLTTVRGELVFDHISFDYGAAMGNIVLSSVKRFGKTETTAGVLSASDGKQERGFTGGDLRATHPASSGGTRQALEDISFTLPPGRLAALVGPSGAGKTTISYLIPRLYDPSVGRVLLDGIDLRDLTLESLTSSIGMVMQETYLFHDTIRENLLYAKPDATDAQLASACEAANIHSFIRGLPEGYETHVGERGYRLSGGEKQRIAIARVILKDPRILVLDEATSHLDSASEELIQEALSRVMKGRTSIVIAHRLSTILAADMILVMNRGRIVGRGTHEELLSQGGLYAGLFESQFRRGGRR
jgi:ATP-binding cassette subfamily B protein